MRMQTHTNGRMMAATYARNLELKLEMTKTKSSKSRMDSQSTLYLLCNCLLTTRVKRSQSPFKVYLNGTGFQNVTWLSTPPSLLPKMKMHQRSTPRSVSWLFLIVELSIKKLWRTLSHLECTSTPQACTLVWSTTTVPKRQCSTLLKSLNSHSKTSLLLLINRFSLSVKFMSSMT